MQLKRINKILLTGLVAVLPVTGTIYFFFWLMRSTENFFGVFLQFFLPQGWYAPGMGVMIGLALIFSIGLLMELFFVRVIVDKFEGVIYRVPLVKSIYGSMREFLAFLLEGGKSKGPRQTVLVAVGDTGMKVMGFVTKTDLSFLGQGLDSTLVAVYFPLSYQIGGYTLLVPRSLLEPVDIPIDRAMKFAMTAGIIERDALRGKQNSPPAA
ncbi:DUF502 domain-containing protein [Thiovibrio sp. JS02]